MISQPYFDIPDFRYRENIDVVAAWAFQSQGLEVTFLSHTSKGSAIVLQDI